MIWADLPGRRDPDYGETLRVEYRRRGGEGAIWVNISFDGYSPVVVTDVVDHGTHLVATWSGRTTASRVGFSVSGGSTTADLARIELYAATFTYTPADDGAGLWPLRQRQSLIGGGSWPVRQRQNGGNTGSWPLRQRQRGV